MRRPAFGWAWVALATAIALHVLDEATHDFLAVYNPSALAIRARFGLPFPPVFSYRVWISGLALGILVLLACTPLAFSRSRRLAWLALPLGILMMGNGAGHIVSSVANGRLMPGTISSPVLIACAVALLFSATGTLRAARSSGPVADQKHSVQAPRIPGGT